MNNYSNILRQWLRAHSRAIATTLVGVIILSTSPIALADQSSSWDPTLLVNTESFQIIDEGDSTTDIEIRFGESLNERLYYDRSEGRFFFTKHLRVSGDISATGSLTIGTGAQIFLSSTGSVFNEWGGDADFRIEGDTEPNLFFLDASVDRIGIGTSAPETTLEVQGTISGETLAIPGTTTFNGVTYTWPTSVATATGKVLKVDPITGQLVWSDDASAAVSQSDLDDRYVNISGDTMTGALIIGSAAGLTVSGNVLFQSGLTVSGAAVFQNNLTVSGAVIFQSGNLSINNVEYYFPSVQASGTGRILVNDGAGNLTWTDQNDIVDDSLSVLTTSGGVVGLVPEYPGVSYYGSGSVSTRIGRLRLRHERVDNGETINFYRWRTSRSSLTNYWIAVQVRIPETFSSWDPVKPIEFRYRTTTALAADNFLTMKFYDTNASEVLLTGASSLKNTSWTTATITGPESSGTFTAGGYITILVNLSAKSSNNADAGYINLNWETNVK